MIKTSTYIKCFLAGALAVYNGGGVEVEIGGYLREGRVVCGARAVEGVVLGGGYARGPAVTSTRRVRAAGGSARRVRRVRRVGGVRRVGHLQTNT